MINSIEINIGGKDRYLKFNQETLEIFHKKMDYEVVSRAPYAMIYAGLVAGARIKEQDIDFTWEDSCDWVDQLRANGGQDRIDEADKIFGNTDAFKKWVDNIRSLPADDSEDVKKNLA